MTDVSNEVSVTSSPIAPAPQEYKSVVPSVFFGFFAAPFQAHNAKKRGLKGNRYWAAAAISTFGGVVLMGLLAVIVGLAASKAINAQDPNINPGAGNSQPSTTTVAPPSDALVLPTESITDSPQQVADELSAVLSKALSLGDARYLDHFFGPDNKTSGGYATALNIIQGGGRHLVYPATNVSATNITPGHMTLTYTLNAQFMTSSASTVPVSFDGAEWLVN
jgi:hypothetical protein